MFSSSANSAVSTFQSAFNAGFYSRYCYLHFVDIDRLEAGNFYSDYEQREAGYGKAILSAYRFAFAETINRKITPGLIKGIHARAMSHLSGEYGQYRNVSGSLLLGFTEVQTERRYSTNPNATLSGFWQLLNTWMIDEKKPLHFLHFKPVNAGADQLFLFHRDYQKKRQLWIQIINGKRQILLQQPYVSRLQPRIEDILMHHTEYQCYLNVYPTDIMASLGYTKPIRELANDTCDSICAAYNKAITNAKNADEVILVVATHAQLLEQAHVFDDGNIRTLNILINRLLHEEGLPLTILLNPNRLDGFSVGQLVDTIKAGQAYYLALTRGVVPTFSDPYLRIKPQVDVITIPNAEAEVEHFITIVQRNLERITPPQLAASLAAAAASSAVPASALCMHGTFSSSPPSQKLDVEKVTPSLR